METHIKCPPEPQLYEKLKQVLESLPQEIVRLLFDFSEVEIITGSSISSLLKLRKALEGRNGHIVLCKVKHRTKTVFITANLEKAFVFSE